MSGEQLYSDDLCSHFKFQSQNGSMDATPLEPTPPTSESDSPGEITMATTTELVLCSVQVLCSHHSQSVYSVQHCVCTLCYPPLPLPQVPLSLLSPKKKESTEWVPLPVQSLSSVQLNAKAGKGRRRRRKRGTLQGALPRGERGRRVT